jgi:hypothetical protein
VLSFLIKLLLGLGELSLELAPEAVEFELLPALLGVKELLPFI